MPDIDITSEDAVKAFVQGCGVTPNNNYLVVNKRAPSWAAMTMLMRVNNEDELDYILAQHEEHYLLIFTADYMLFAQITPKNVPVRRVDYTDISQFADELITEQECLHFLVHGKRENYYSFALYPPTPQYTLHNYHELQRIGFYGLMPPIDRADAATSAPSNHPTMEEFVDRNLGPVPPKLQAKMDSESQAKAASPQSTQPAPSEAHPHVIENDDIPDGARPEEKRPGLLASLFGKPRRR
jgi:hypothetical protein